MLLAARRIGVYASHLIPDFPQVTLNIRKNMQVDGRPTRGGSGASPYVPPPPALSPKGAVTWVVCPLGPPAYVDSSTATRVNNPGRPGGRAALSVSWGPSNGTANPPWDATQP